MAFINPKKVGPYVLTAKGASIKDDQSNVGQKLLKKMGWIAESGLGKNGNGVVDPIKASSNFGRKGFGTGPTESSSGMPQQAAFSEVLKSLSKHQIQTNFTPKTKLEEKSKKSRSRVHYGKFVRAKDVSQYSEEYLRVILGTSCDDNSCNSIYQNETNNSDMKSPKNAFGVKTYSSSINLHEYFSMKKRLKKEESSVRNGGHSPTSSMDEPMSSSMIENSLFPTQIKIEERTGKNISHGVGVNQEISGDVICLSENKTEQKEVLKQPKQELFSDSSNSSESEHETSAVEEKPCIRSSLFKTSNMHDLTGYPYY